MSTLLVPHLHLAPAVPRLRAQADGAMLVVSCLSMHMRAMHGTPYYSLSHNMCGIQLVVLEGTFVPS